MEEKKWGNGYRYDKANPFPITSYPLTQKRLLLLLLFLMERG